MLLFWTMKAFSTQATSASSTRTAGSIYGRPSFFRIHTSGRKKDVLVLPDGTKIFCPEYEEALSEALGTDELAVTLRRGRAVLLVQDKVRKEAAEAAVSDLNRKLPRSQQIAGILSVSVPLPRTLTGKLKRWMIEKAILKGDFEEWKQ